MSKHKKTYFVVLNGGKKINADVLELLTTNFDDLSHHSSITVVSEKQTVSVEAWELSKEHIQLLKDSLKRKGYNFDFQVVIKVDDNPIRLARREEYDDGYKKTQSKENGTQTRVKKTVVGLARKVSPRNTPFFIALEPKAQKVKAPQHPELPFGD